MNDKRNKSIRIRVTEEEHKKITKRANKKGFTISTFIRIVALGGKNG